MIHINNVILKNNSLALAIKKKVTNFYLLIKRGPLPLFQRGGKKKKLKRFDSDSNMIQFNIVNMIQINSVVLNQFPSLDLNIDCLSIEIRCRFCSGSANEDFRNIFYWQHC